MGFRPRFQSIRCVCATVICIILATCIHSLSLEAQRAHVQPRGGGPRSEVRSEKGAHSIPRVWLDPRREAPAALLPGPPAPGPSSLSHKEAMKFGCGAPFPTDHVQGRSGAQCDQRLGGTARTKGSPSKMPSRCHVL